MGRGRVWGPRDPHSELLILAGCSWDFTAGARWVLGSASLTPRREGLCCPLGQLPMSSPCAMLGIQIFLSAFCKSQHLPEAFGCCLFQLLPAEGMHRNAFQFYFLPCSAGSSRHTEPWCCPLSRAMPSCARDPPRVRGEAAFLNILTNSLVPDLLWWQGEASASSPASLSQGD